MKIQTIASYKGGLPSGNTEIEISNLQGEILCDIQRQTRTIRGVAECAAVRAFRHGIYGFLTYAMERGATNVEVAIYRGEPNQIQIYFRAMKDGATLGVRTSEYQAYSWQYDITTRHDHIDIAMLAFYLQNAKGLLEVQPNADGHIYILLTSDAEACDSEPSGLYGLGDQQLSLIECMLLKIALEDRPADQRAMLEALFSESQSTLK